MSLSNKMQADIIDAFNTTSRYLDNILNNNDYFDNMVSQIPSEFRLNKANACISNDMFLPKIMINVTTPVMTLILKLSISHF